MAKPAPNYAELKTQLQNALLLAGVTFFAAWPMFLFQYHHLPGPLLGLHLSADALFRLSRGQALIVFFLAFLCALVGFLYSERLGLPRFGRARDMLAWLGWGLVGGIIFMPGVWLLVDRTVLTYAPLAYPDTWDWALADMLGTAVTQEVLARFGLLTIGIYFWQHWGRRGHPHPIIALIAGFGALGTFLFLHRFGLATQLPPLQTGCALGLAFLLQWLLCELYLRYGFLATVCVHIGLNVRFLVYAVML